MSGDVHPVAESGEAHKVAETAETLINLGFANITNSMITTWIVILFIVIFVRSATKKVEMVPSGKQNLLEFFYEGVHNLLAGILGPELTKKSLWFFASLFLFIMITNWSGLIPFTGNFVATFKNETGHLHDVPLWRPGSADVALNISLALIFMFFWLKYALEANGVVGFFKHIFAPKGQFEGIMLPIMIVLSVGIGFIEIFSILFRPISLSLRLYGNIYGGENVMHAMALPFVQIPFYFLELLVGLIQALVFTMLAAVFTAIICEHDDHQEHEKEH